MATPMAPWGLVVSRLDRIIFDPDTTPPSTPVMNTPTVVDSSRIDFSWTASTDTGGSGLARYELFTDGTTTITLGIQTSYSLTGLATGSLHNARVRAIDGNNNPSSYSNQVSATTTGPSLAWQTTIPQQELTVGVPFSLDLDTLCTGAIGYSLLSGALPTGVSLNSSTGVVSGTPTTIQLVTPTLRATDNNAQSDWTLRSQGAGVVWAQRFTSDADVSKYIVHGSSTLASIVPTYKRCNTADGILGDGCLELLTPANDSQAGRGSWVKPFLPISGVDVNNAGVTTMSDFAQVQDSGVWDNPNLGGYFAKAAGTGVIGNEFYLQYRCKISPNRLNSNIPRGKNINISVNRIGTPHQEIVCDWETSYGGWLSYYTNGGNAWNTSIYDPQRGSYQNNDKIQNQAPYATTCIIGNAPGQSGNCWRPIPGNWFTIMFRIKPGSQYVTQSSPTAGSNPKDQLLEIWVADAGQTTFTKIYSKTDLQFEFETGVPFGYNCFQMTDFTGGGAEITSPEAFYHRFDQIILSTQAIPCPQA